MTPIEIEFHKSVPYVSTCYSHACTTSPGHRTYQTLYTDLWNFLHSASSCRRVCGCGWRCLTALASWSHKCSIGLKSCENAGHRSVSMFCCCKKSFVAQAEWGRSLSCWNIVTSWWAARNGTTVVRRTSLMYLWDVSVPSMIIRGVRCRKVMQPHTITLPPPNLRAHNSLRSVQRVVAIFGYARHCR